MAILTFRKPPALLKISHPDPYTTITFLTAEDTAGHAEIRQLILEARTELPPALSLTWTQEAKDLETVRILVPQAVLKTRFKPSRVGRALPFCLALSDAGEYVYTEGAVTYLSELYDLGLEGVYE